MAPAKAAYAVTVMLFILAKGLLFFFLSPLEIHVREIVAPPLAPLPNWGGAGSGAGDCSSLNSGFWDLSSANELFSYFCSGDE
jgi:hypothetical protein